MAKKKSEPKKVLERTYNVPLRKEWLKVARNKRTKKAVKALKEFLMKHMKSTDILIFRELNLHLWKNGIRNPPHHVKVNAVKDDTGVVKVQLFGVKIEEKPKEKKVSKKEEDLKKDLGLEKMVEKPKEEVKEEKTKKKAETQEETKKEEKKVEVKKEEKKAAKKE